MPIGAQSKSIWGDDVGAPPLDCVEVSVFGVGVGESILVHLGAGHWFVVDSCRDPLTKRPAALGYLDAIGATPDSVQACVCTHFHLDHVDGLSEILGASRGARMFIPEVLLSQDIATLAAFYRGDQISPADLPGSMSEFWKLLLELESPERSIDTIQFAGPDRLLVSLPSGTTAFSLSPSDKANAIAKVKYLQFKPAPRTYRRLPSIGGPNDVAVAIWISANDRHVLLGSDLENHHDQDMGWNAALRCQCIGGNRAYTFKVAHHGSPNADSSHVWQDCTHQGQVISVMTTYSPSDLPGKDDVERIKSHSSAVYCATQPKSTVRRDPAVDRTLREAGTKLRQVKQSLGHIRVRYLATGEMDVKLFGTAVRL